MKCPKCGFTSFPYLESCRKCGLVLAESQAAWGLYALHPDPPDLLLAYQTANLDVTRTPPLPPASMPSLDLGAREKIEPAIAKAQPVTPGPDESEEPFSPAPDLLPTLDQEIMTAAESPPLEPHTEPPGSAETVMPHSLDLSELADMTLELDHTVNLGDTSAQSPQPPKFSPEEQPVYDLDLNGDLDELSLLPLADESSTEDADGDEEVLEYTLEIEDNLEFEIDGLELEQDDDTEDEDDDEP
ncbi:MAG TPA: hypothetical protein VGC99_14590 [Candidatus Tectomicrobia bacterium]